MRTPARTTRNPAANPAADPAAAPSPALADATAEATPQPSLYALARRFCIQHPGPQLLTPGLLMREFRVTYSQACRLLEELERDHVLRSAGLGKWSNGIPRFGLSRNPGSD